MNLRHYIKQILIFSLTFILGMFSVIKSDRFQENKRASPQTELIQRSVTNSESEVSGLKEKLHKFYKNRCEVNFEECSFSGISLYEAHDLLEYQYIEFQIDLIKGKKEGLNQEKVRFGELKLKGIESEIGKIKNRIKKFERDIKAGKIDRNAYNRSLIYFEKCIQK